MKVINDNDILADSAGDSTRDSTESLESDFMESLGDTSVDSPLQLSNLSKTWLIDIDGTIVWHNGYKIYGKDRLLEGVREFFDSIPKDDTIILLTARKQNDIKPLQTFLKSQNLRFDRIISDLPCGERILVNDNKPSGLKMAYAINIKRNSPLKLKFHIDKDL